MGDDDTRGLQLGPDPKLRRFVDHNKPIRYIKELGRGAESVVYLVIVNGKEYAMKLVSYIILTYLRDRTLVQYLLTLQIVVPPTGMTRGLPTRGRSPDSYLAVFS